VKEVNNVELPVELVMPYGLKEDDALELEPGGLTASAENELAYLLDELSDAEAIRVLIAARALRKQHKASSATASLYTATIWERG
jgi:hypothetical protein